MNRFAILPLVLVLIAAPQIAQDNPLLSATAAGEVFTRASQLMESTMITVPGLARSADPVLENCRAAMNNLRAERNLHPGHTYTLLTNLRAYLALSDSMPKPYPYPEEATLRMASAQSSTSDASHPSWTGRRTAVSRSSSATGHRTSV